jgi:membrane protease YdiL (CAAX protease family)
MWRNKNGQVRSGWLILLTTIIFIIAELLFSLPGFFLFEGMVNTEGMTFDEIVVKMSEYPWIELLANGGPVFAGIVVILLIWKFINKGTLVELGLSMSKKNMRDFAAGLFLGILAISVVFFTLLVSGNLLLEKSLFEPQFSVYSLTFLILFLGVGFAEEIFFRGYMMKTMEHRGNPKWAIYGVTAFLFALFHGMNPNVSSFGLINIALAGLLFSFMYDLTKNLWMPIGYHITWNYFQGNVFDLPVSGTDPHGIYDVKVVEGNEWLTGGMFGPEAGALDTIVTALMFLLTWIYVRRQKRRASIR